MDFKMHEYTHAIVGKGPENRDKTNFNDAAQQHECYLRLLRELEIEVIEADFGSNFPRNVLLEDVAIVCHGVALLPMIVASGETHKTKVVKDVLEKLGQTVIEVKDENAKILGSDVLFTGHELFVGISETSNEAGASALAEAFPEFPCTPIKMSKGLRHLKSYITVAGPDILCVGASKEAKEVVKRMEREANYPYQTLTVPEDDAANCLYLNGTLIHRAIEEIPSSFNVFCERIDFSRRSICFSEIAKLSCGLTSSCILATSTGYDKKTIEGMVLKTLWEKVFASYDAKNKEIAIKGLRKSGDYDKLIHNLLKVKKEKVPKLLNLFSEMILLYIS